MTVQELIDALIDLDMPDATVSFLVQIPYDPSVGGEEIYVDDVIVKNEDEVLII